MPKEVKQRTIYTRNPMYFRVDLHEARVKKSLEIDLLGIEMQVASEMLSAEDGAKQKTEREALASNQLTADREETDIVHFRLLPPSTLERMTVIYQRIFREESAAEKALLELHGVTAKQLSVNACLDGVVYYTVEQSGANDKKAVLARRACVYHWEEDKVILFPQPTEPFPAVWREATARHNELNNAISGAYIGAFWYHQTLALETPIDLQQKGQTVPLGRLFNDPYRYGLEVYEELLYSHWAPDDIVEMYLACTDRWQNFFTGPTEKEVKREADFLPPPKAGGSSSGT